MIYKPGEYHDRKMYKITIRREITGYRDQWAAMEWSDYGITDSKTDIKDAVEAHPEFKYICPPNEIYISAGAMDKVRTFISSAEPFRYSDYRNMDKSDRIPWGADVGNWSAWMCVKECYAQDRLTGVYLPDTCRAGVGCREYSPRAEWDHAYYWLECDHGGNCVIDGSVQGAVPLTEKFPFPKELIDG